MGIGIDIRVNRQQVTDAKREIELLADKAGKLGDKEFTIGGGVNSGSSAVSGSDATVNAGAMDRTAKSAMIYRKEMEATRRIVSDTAKDYDKLIKISAGFRGASATATPVVGTVSAAESARMHKESQKAAEAYWKSTGEPSKRETAADRYFKEHGNYGRTVMSRADSDGADGGSSVSSMGSTIKKAVGWGLAAAGGFSLLGFLGSSRAQYQQAVGHEGKLNARGIKGGYNDGVGIGIGPLEQMQMLENISQSTGMSGKRATSAANMAGTFGKFAGVDPSQVAGLYGTMYQATGNQQAGTGALTMMAEAVKKGMEKARVSELLQLVSRNTQATAQAMGGAGSSKEVGAATALAIEATKSQQAGANYGKYANSGEFQHVMQNGLQGAGTGAGDIRLFKALGGFDGPMSFEKIHEMNIMKQGGFLQNPALMSKILGSLSSTTDKGKAGELETMMDSWGIKGLASEKIIGMSKKDDKTGMSFFDQLEKAIKKSGSFEKLSKGSAEDKKMYSEMQKAIGENPALAKEALEATRQKEHIAAGDALNQAFYKLEDAALKAAAAITNSRAADAAIKTGQWLGDAAGGNPNTAAAIIGGTVAAVGFWKFGKWFPKGSKLPPGVTATGGSAIPEAFGANAARATGFVDELESAAPKALKTGGKLAKVGKVAGPLAMLATLPFEIKDDFDKFSERRRENELRKYYLDAAKKTGEDPLLLMAIGKTESRNKRKAVSKAGAKGVMQLMPGTGKEYGLKSDDDFFDPAKNIMAGAMHMAALRKQYPGASNAKLLKIYNEGGGNYAKHGFNGGSKEAREYAGKVDENYHELSGGWMADISGKKSRILEYEPQKPDGRIDAKMAEAGALGDMIANAINGAMERIFKLPTDYLKQIADNTANGHSISARAPSVGNK